MTHYAVLGSPIRHSVSPAMQGAAFATAGLAATYEPIEVAPEELPALFARLRTAGYRGWNVTVPHKEQAFRLVDERDASALRAGGVNTVVNESGRLIGHSTDGYGMLTALRECFQFDPQTPEVQVAVLGCGGAGRAVAAEFAAAGVRRLLLINRTLSRAEDVARQVLAATPECQVTCLTPGDAAALGPGLAQCTVLVQSTSLGLHAGDPLPLAPGLLPASLAVMDMIYRVTPFQAAARGQGCRVADGRWMLLHQGARSFTLWTGVPAPVEAMRQALLAALGR